MALAEICRISLACKARIDRILPGGKVRENPIGSHGVSGNVQEFPGVDCENW